MAKPVTYPAVIAGQPLGDSAAMLSLGMSPPKPAASRYFTPAPTHQKTYPGVSVKPTSNKRS